MSRTYSYVAFDGQNRITRDNLTIDKLALHWSNLVVSGYVVNARDDATGEPVPEDVLAAEAARSRTGT